MMYQSFMSAGIIPLEWKSAIIVPIFKKGEGRFFGPIKLSSNFTYKRVQQTYGAMYSYRYVKIFVVMKFNK